MKIYVFGLIALFTLTASCQTTYSQFQSQQAVKAVCSERYISCPQNRNYSVTYDNCCSFPVTYKLKESKKVIIIHQKEEKQISFSTAEE
ncbi:MAG: hypothetical protein DSY34_00185 [Desulfurobacterium sp.]|nr:MAG: hypothetical protein DSY34_00185 [Desulfurobacterium sp.]